MVRLVLGLAMTVAALAIAGRRVHLPLPADPSGQAAPGRLDGIGQRAKDQLREVFGQRKLLQWSVPGAAHFLTFWALHRARRDDPRGLRRARSTATSRSRSSGTGRCSGFLEDFFAVAVLRVAGDVLGHPAAQTLRSAGSGRHASTARTPRAAWLVLFMIFNVIWTLLLYRGAQINTGVFPFQEDGWWAFASKAAAELLEPLGEDDQRGARDVGILAQIGVVLGFLVLVVYSKHLHIFIAPLNVLTKREPKALGPLLPMMVDGKPIDFENSTSSTRTPSSAAARSRTSPGRACSTSRPAPSAAAASTQCPAWNTGKPLSPKLLIMDLRDHLFAKAPLAPTAPRRAARTSRHAASDPARPTAGSRR